MTCVSDTNFPVTQAVRRTPDFYVNKKKRAVISFISPFQMTCRRNRLKSVSCRVVGIRITLMRTGTDPDTAFRTLARIRIWLQLPEITRIRNPASVLIKSSGYLTYLPVSTDIDFHLLNPNTEIVAQNCTTEKMKNLLLDALY